MGVGAVQYVVIGYAITRPSFINGAHPGTTSHPAKVIYHNLHAYNHFSFTSIPCFTKCAQYSSNSRIQQSAPFSPKLDASNDALIPSVNMDLFQGKQTSLSGNAKYSLWMWSRLGKLFSLSRVLASFYVLGLQLLPSTSHIVLDPAECLLFAAPQ